MVKAVNEVPVIGISITEQIGKRAIVLQSHVASDLTDEEINTFVDRVMGLADRQKLYYETREGLHELRLNLENHEFNLENMLKDLAQTDDRTKAEWDAGGRRGEYKLSKSQQTHRDNVLKTADTFKLNIERLKKGIEENEAILKKIGR